LEEVVVGLEVLLALLVLCPLHLHCLHLLLLLEIV
jgi:hypothetical protein